MSNDWTFTAVISWTALIFYPFLFKIILISKISLLFPEIHADSVRQEWWLLLVDYFQHSWDHPYFHKHIFSVICFNWCHSVSVNVKLICKFRVHLHFNLKLSITPCFLYLAIFHFPSRLFMQFYYFRILPIAGNIVFTQNSCTDDVENCYGMIIPSAISTFTLTYVIFAWVNILDKKMVLEWLEHFSNAF